MALSLTEYNTSAAASIAAGSKVEIAGAFFTFAGDEAIEASTWTSIVTGNTAYITLTASGTAGSQIVVAAYTATAPTWRDDLQGWYASAASNVRVIGSVYKAEATNYASKHVFDTIKQGVNPYTIRSLNVFGTLSTSSSLSVAGRLIPNGITPIGSIYSTGTTQGYLFTLLSPSIPATNNSVILNGMLGQMVFSHASRISATGISIYGLTTDVYAPYTLSISSGSGTALGASISACW